MKDYALMFILLVVALFTFTYVVADHPDLFAIGLNVLIKTVIFVMIYYKFVSSTKKEVE